MKFLAIAGLAVTFALNATAPAARADAPVFVRGAPAMDTLVEGLMAKIRMSKSLPGWALNAAMNAYAVYKTYRNGEKVEEINAAVLAMLKEIADIKAEADKGREMTKCEYRLTRDLLNSYGSRLSGYETRLRSLKRDLKLTRNQLAPWRCRCRVCQQAENVRRRNLCRRLTPWLRGGAAKVGSTSGRPAWPPLHKRYGFPLPPSYLPQ